MRKARKRILISIMLLSIFLNVFFGFYYYQEQKKKKNDLINAVRYITVHINQAADRLTLIEESHPDNRNHIIGATRDIAVSKGWIEAYAKDMPRNLVSWIGGIEVGLGNGAYGIDEEGFKMTVHDLLNFNDGYLKETNSINIDENPEETLKIIEDVLSNKKYMGNNYMNK